MTPGPDYIYECPNCGSLLKRGSINSGNTFISTLYSDGKMIAPMLPEFPNLTKCRKCDSILWLSEMKEIGIGEEVEKRKTNCKPWRKVLKKLFSKGLLDPTDYVRFLEFNPEEKKKAECKSERKNAMRVGFLDITDLFRFLEWDIVKNDIEKEKYVRNHIWWTFNDRIRTNKASIIFYEISEEIFGNRIV